MNKMCLHVRTGRQNMDFFCSQVSNSLEYIKLVQKLPGLLAPLLFPICSSPFPKETKIKHLITECSIIMLLNIVIIIIIMVYNDDFFIQHDNTFFKKRHGV